MIHTLWMPPGFILRFTSSPAVPAGGMFTTVDPHRSLVVKVKLSETTTTHVEQPDVHQSPQADWNEVLRQLDLRNKDSDVLRTHQFQRLDDDLAHDRGSINTGRPWKTGCR